MVEIVGDPVDLKVDIPDVSPAGTNPYREVYNALANKAQLKSPATFVPLSEVHVDFSLAEIKLIAFYLPQFHPIAENDREWGKGFTEWTNVSKAVPQFVGHYQPRLPGELGFYDLRVKDTQRRQIELAKQYGIHGFCYHHYWFAGKKVLDRPFQQVLEDSSLDLPFCLCWANENWTRRWDGGEDEIIFGQHHTPEDDLAFIKDLAPALRDSRYIRVDGRPLLIVYRPGLLPDPKATAERWRRYTQENGIGDLFLVAAATFAFEDYKMIGFDGLVQFPPHNIGATEISHGMQWVNMNFQGYVFDYDSVVRETLKALEGKEHTFPCVMTEWDNEARKPGKGHVYYNGSPLKYKDWLQAATDYVVEQNTSDERLVFINAWNEWAEGTYLEPDRYYGYAYLDATREVLTKTIKKKADRKIVLVTHDSHPCGAQYLVLNMAKVLIADFGFEVALVTLGEGQLKDSYSNLTATYDLTGKSQDGKEAIILAQRLVNKGFQAALVNSTASGLFLNTLADAGVQCVGLVHELPGIIGSYKLQSHAESFANRAAAVVFPTRQVAEAFPCKSLIPPDKLHVRPQGLYKLNAYRGRNDVARALLRKELGLPENAMVILGVGYADYRKGIDLFVETGLQVVPLRPEVFFVWLGHWDPTAEKKIQDELAENPYAGNFLFPGRRDDTDLFYAGAHLFALTSREDPFPSVVMESLNVGVPVIGFSGCSGSENLLRQGCGVLVPREDCSRFADAICSLLDEPAKISSLGREGSAIIEASFSFRQYLFELLGMAGFDLKRVSVIVPNYNYARYLEQRFQSIVDQSYPIYELIVLDDASTDNSSEVIERLLGSQPVDHKFVTNNQNSGSVFSQWLKAIEMAQGDFVWIAEADDVAQPRFLEKSMDLFCCDQLVMSFTQSRQIDENGKLIGDHYLEYTNGVSNEKWYQDYICDGKIELAEALSIKNTIPNVSAVIFRKSALKQALEQCQDELGRLNIAGDWLVYAEVLRLGMIGFVAEPLNSHRRHQKSVTISSSSYARHLAEIMYLQQRVARMVQLDGETKSKAKNYGKEVYRQFGLDQTGPREPLDNYEVRQAFTEIAGQDIP